MKMSKRYLGLIGLIAMLGFSNAAYAACLFNSAVPIPPDGASDLSGQGNFSCDVFTGPTGVSMVPVVVDFIDNGDGTWNWEMPNIVPGTIVENTPDHVVLFPQGQGSRCDYQYLSRNATEGTGLDTGGRIDTRDSIACTDGIANSVEVEITEEPELVTTTEDSCAVTLSAETSNGRVITQADFAVFTGTNLDGSIQAVCNGVGATQNECVRGCPDFIDTSALQDQGICLPDIGSGRIPFTDARAESPDNPEGRCTPCLTAAQAEEDPRFDTGGLKFCWEYTNSVNIANSTYRPHKPIRSQTTEIDFFNECYTTTTIINFFGREIPKSVTTCD